MDDKIADRLEQEYLFLQKTVEDFDGKALTIKAWSVTFSAAGLGFAYQQHNPKLLLVAAGSALVFWIVESVWKYNQRAYYPRIFKIEEWFAANSEKGSEPFQITSRWKNEFGGFTKKWLYPSEKRWRSLGIPFFMGVMLPHVVVFVAGILLFFVAAPASGEHGVEVTPASVQIH